MATQQPQQLEPSEEGVRIVVRLETTTSPAIFDLSLVQPLEFLFQIRRGRGDNEGIRPMTLLIIGSALDGINAISSGLLQLVDREDKTVINLKDMESTISWPESSRSPYSMNDALITLPSRCHLPLDSKVIKGQYDIQLPIELPITFKDHLKADHRYCLEMAETNLNVCWWNWGSRSELGIGSDTTPESLPQSEMGKIFTSGSHTNFTVVDSLPTPPTLTVKLLAPLPLSPLSASNTKSSGRDGGGEEGKENEEQYAIPSTAVITQPRFLITTTNNCNQAITVKSNLAQRYISSQKDSSLGMISSEARITSQHRPPSIRNFSILDTTTIPHEELMPPYISPSAPPNKGHHQRHNYTTLEPGVPITTAVEFHERLVRRMSGCRCVLTLRSFGVWWVCGGVEDLFARGWRELMTGDLKPPLILESDDRLVFELPALGDED